MTIPRIGPSEPAKLIIRSALAGAAARFQANDPAARLGNVDGVHRLRTATRRLRGELHAFRHLLDRTWRESIEADLKWLAGALGGVRDLDVLDARLRSAAARLRRDRPPGPAGGTPTFGETVAPDAALDRLFESIRMRHAGASVEMRDALRSDRYSRLVEAIARAIETVPEHLSDRADAPCRDVLPPLARAAWKHLERGAKALRRRDPHDDFHDVRKRCKRARHTAELIAPALGRKRAEEAARFVRLTTRVQDVLGEHQDAVVAADQIAKVRAEHAGDAAFVRAADLLLEDQRRAAESARDSFFAVWEKADRKKARRWMKPRSD